MGRAWRIEYEGALYHVLSRGNARKDNFIDDVDRESFIDILRQTSERFGIKLYAFVLMSNHYHLLFKTVQPNLSKAMQWLGSTYTRRFNLRHHLSGHLFQGRFHSVVVENDAYMMQLSCYIHRNPLRAGLVNRLADYNWSSYKTYAHKKPGYDWLSTQLILDQFKGVKDRQRAYRGRVRRYAGEEKRLWEDFRHGCIIGTQQFVEDVRQKYLGEKPHDEIPQQKRVVQDIDIQRRLGKAAAALGCDIARLAGPGRIAVLEKSNRDALVYCLWQTGLLSNRQIGDMFTLTYSFVSHIVRHTKANLEKNRDLKRKVETACSLLNTS